MRRLYVELDDRAFDRLATLAIKERRDVRDQAAILLERTLDAAGSRRGLTSGRDDQRGVALPAGAA